MTAKGLNPPSAAALAGWSGAALVAAGVLSAATVYLRGDEAWRDGFVAATAAAVFAASLTVPLLAWSLRRPLEVAASLVLLLSGLRAGLTLAAAAGLIVAAGSPKAPTLLFCVPYYFALLAAETAVAGRAMWDAKAEPPETSRDSTE